MADPKTVAVKGLADVFPPQGSQFSLLVQGTDTYEELRVGRGILVQNEDKTRQMPGNITALRVGALIELMGEYGQSNILSYGKPYSLLAGVQAMTDAAGADTLDVTKLYTGVMDVVTGPVGDVAPVTGSTSA